MRPLSPAAARALLLVIGTAFCALAVNASVLLPLWEPADEHEHWLVVAHWARTGTMPDLTDLPVLALNEGVQPPLAYWMFAAGARALDLGDVHFLERRVRPPDAERTVQFLHGADEVFPFAGPVRRFHLLRLLDVLCGLGAVLASFALGRVLAPGRPAVAAGTAALVAFNPAFVTLCGGLSNDPLAVALATVALLRLARLARDPAPTARGGLLTGALVGLALLAKLSSTFLLPLVPLALLLRRPRGEPWSASLVQLDWIAAGFLPVTGLYFAWNLATYGDPFGWSVIAAKFGGQRALSVTDAFAQRFVPNLLASYVAQLSGVLRAGTLVRAAWAVVAVGAVVGALALPVVRAMQRRRERLARRHARSVAAASSASAAAPASAATPASAVPGADLRVALLLGAAVLVNLLAMAKYFLDFNQPHGRYLFATLPALAGLLALAWCWLPRPAALPAGAALALVAFHAQVHELGPAFWPPARVHDPHFMAFDPLADVPAERRLPLLPLLAPADRSRHREPPTIRWPLPDDPEARYTVHLSTPGIVLGLESYEDGGHSLRDRYTIPAEQWYGLPPGVPLEVRVIRLPTLEDVLASPPGALDVEESEVLTVRRLPAPGE